MRKQKSAPYLFIAPFYILFATFMVYPIIFSLKASLTSWNGVQEMKWVGLGNYAKLIHDKVFLQALVNGVIMFFMYVPFMLLLALLLAVILNRPRQKFKSFFRMAYFIPNITCVVAIAYVFLLMFDTNYGLVNKVLMSIGIPAIRWFGSAFGARLVIGILVTWKYMGYNMILMMAGLQTIDESLIEAAKIDGAGSIKVFTRITIPLIIDNGNLLIVLGTIDHDQWRRTSL